MKRLYVSQHAIEKLLSSLVRIASDSEAVIVASNCETYCTLFCSIKDHSNNLLLCFFCSIGAPGVGRSHIKSSLLLKYPEKFAYPSPRKSLIVIEGKLGDFKYANMQ